ncbi:hypothetical protein DCC62_05310 [candidate division KSB1 bacterium]|nr:MAG: hypothetical protein DCC62_05310 [candidate division KSB1 bacterium]
MQNLRHWLLDSARAEAERHFEPASLICLIPRETAWYAITLLESARAADHALANRILENLTVNDGTHSPATLFVIHQRYPALLSNQAKEQILKNLRQNLPISALVRYSDGNVNHPLAAYAHLICGGELLGDPAYTRLGRLLLQEFHQTISNRRHKNHQQAEMAEYNSPTYTALTLWFLAIIAEFAQDEEARQLAQFLEERLWINVAMHWHEPTQQFAGPFSRAYAEDSVGGFSALHCTFACAMQRNVFIAAELPRRFEHPSALIENAFVAILNFHVPAEAKAIAFEKSLPYYFRMTTYCEQYHENGRRQENYRQVAAFDDEVYPGGWGDLTTFMTKEYCLGTASRPYVNAGQSDGFSMRYRRTENMQSLQDFRGAYTRMVFNGAVVGQDNFCHVAGFPINKDYLYEEGRAFTYQHENKAIVCYTPKRAGHAAVSELRFDLIFSHHAPFDHIQVNESEIVNSPFESENVRRIIIFDHRTYLAILPLPASGLADFKPKCRLWASHDHFMISFYNYRGAVRDFTREEMSMTRNGFACLLETLDHFPRLDDFLKFLDGVKLNEAISSRAVRTVEFQIGEKAMVFSIDPISERILARTWNGRDDAVYHFQIETNAGDSGRFCPKQLYAEDSKSDFQTS